MQPYLSEGMYRSLAEEFRLRKAEGLALDPNVLEIGNTEVGWECGCIKGI
jgi:hypothetical protein